MFPTLATAKGLHTNFARVVLHARLPIEGESIRAIAFRVGFHRTVDQFASGLTNETLLAAQ